MRSIYRYRLFAALLAATAIAPASAAALEVSVAPSSVRLTPQTTARPEWRSTIRLQAARGESEGRQLLLKATVQGSIQAELSPLVGPAGDTVSTESIHLYLQRRLNVATASPRGRSGSYYDPLLDFSQRKLWMEQGQQAAFWYDVKVSRGIAPGTYRGTVRFHGAGVDHRVPVVLGVERVQLPIRPRIASSIGLDASQLVRFEGVAWGSVQLYRKIEQYAAVLAEARLSAADIYIDPDTTGSYAAFAESAGGIRLSNFAGTDGVSAIQIPFHEDQPFASPLGSDRAAAVRYLRWVAGYFRSRGLLRRSYVYIVDEPSDADAVKVQRFYRLVKEADPGLRVLLTIEPRRPFLGSADIWTVNISHRVSTRQIVEQHRKGKQYWWYPAISTYSPYPTLFIDDVRPSPRAMGWLGCRYGVDGFLYWTATHWQEVRDPWQQADTYHEGEIVGNGDGSLLYPGRPHDLSRPAPSVRLLQLRDGLDDCDLATLARKTRLGRIVSAGVLSGLAPSMTQIASTPAADAGRGRLFSVLRR